MSATTGHVSSDRLGEAAQHGGLDCLRESEQRHVQACEQCQHLYGGYRLADRLLSASWREVKLPAELATRPSRLAALQGFMNGRNARTLAPAASLIAVVALVGAALALPRLMPAPPLSTHSPIASVSATPSAPSSRSAAPSSSTDQTVGPSASNSASTSPSSPASSGPTSLALTRFAGTPIAWSPDGAHLLAWSTSHSLQIRDAAGAVTATVAADDATWVTSTIVAVAARKTGGPGPGASPTPSPTPSRAPGSHWPFKSPLPTVRPTGGHRTFGPGPGPGGSRPETVYLIDLSGRVAATLPNGYPVWGGLPNAMLLGSGTGELTIASQGPASAWQFVLWNGSLSSPADGLPLAFSQDGSRLAVLHPTAVAGGYATGWIEVLAVPSITSLATFPGVSIRVTTGSLGSAYGIDAAFSPNGRFLLASGTLVDLTRGAAVASGRGGWLPDGTLATASSSGLLRWSGTVSTLDPRFSGAGIVGVARHGDLIYLFADGRLLLYLDSSGALDRLSLPAVRSVAHLLISPDGRSIALDGRATDGSSIAAVAHLP